MQTPESDQGAPIRLYHLPTEWSQSGYFLSLAPFPHPQESGSNWPHLTGLRWGWNELTHIKHLCLAHGEGYTTCYISAAVTYWQLYSQQNTQHRLCFKHTLNEQEKSLCQRQKIVSVAKHKLTRFWRKNPGDLIDTRTKKVSQRWWYSVPG